MKYLKLFKNKKYDNTILINANTNAVMLDDMDDLSINKLVIDKAKEISPELFDSDHHC
jgi:hypothetical protein